MESVLDDFAENVSNRLLDLLVDAVLNVSLGVNIDVALGLVALSLEDSAVNALVQVEDV